LVVQDFFIIFVEVINQLKVTNMKKTFKVQVLVTYSVLNIIDVEIEETGNDCDNKINAQAKAEVIASTANVFTANGGTVEEIESTIID